MYQSVPQSIGRVVLSSKNRFQLSRYRTDDRDVDRHPGDDRRADRDQRTARSRLERSASTSSGPRMNSGQSFAAPPSPSRTPASTGRRLAQA